MKTSPLVVTITVVSFSIVKFSDSWKAYGEDDDRVVSLEGLEMMVDCKRDKTEAPANPLNGKIIQLWYGS